MIRSIWGIIHWSHSIHGYCSNVYCSYSIRIHRRQREWNWRECPDATESYRVCAMSGAVTERLQNDLLCEKLVHLIEWKHAVCEAMAGLCAPLGCMCSSTIQQPVNLSILLTMGSRSRRRQQDGIQINDQRCENARFLASIHNQPKINNIIGAESINQSNSQITHILLCSCEWSRRLSHSNQIWILYF